MQSLIVFGGADPDSNVLNDLWLLDLSDLSAPTWTMVCQQLAYPRDLPSHPSPSM